MIVFVIEKHWYDGAGNIECSETIVSASQKRAKKEVEEADKDAFLCVSYSSYKLEDLDEEKENG